MLSLRFAYQTLKKDFRHYALFIGANAFLLMVNALFFAIRNNHSIAQSNYGKIIQAVMVLGLVLSLLVSTVFIFYANSFVAGRRRRQIGTLSMLGLSRWQGALLVGWQSLGLWFLTTIFGLLATYVGLLFAFPALNALAGGQHFQLAFEIQTVVTVALIYAGFFFLVTLVEWLKIGRSNLIDLTKSDQKVAKEPKGNVIFGLLGFVVLLSGYWIALTTKPSLNALFSFICSVGLVIVGTYLVMIVGIAWFLKRLRRNQKYYYQDKHFVPVAGLLFRVKNNGAGLASVAILFTTIVVALSATISMQTVTSKYGQYFPYDTTITAPAALSKDQLSQVEKSASQHHLQLSRLHRLVATNPILTKVSDSGQFTRFTGTGDALAMPVYRALTADSLREWQGKKLNLASDEVGIYATHGKAIPQSVQIGGQTYRVRVIKTMTVPDPTIPSGPSYYYLVVNHQDQIQTFLKEVAQVSGAANYEIDGLTDQVDYTYAYNVTGNHQDEVAFSQDLQKRVFANQVQVADRADAVTSIQTVFGSLVFVGILAAVALTFTTILIVYYKQVAEGLADRENFKKMQRIGLSLVETQAMINRQIRLLFLLPLIILVLNISFAFPILRTAFKTLGLYQGNIFIPILVAVTVVMVFIYLLIYGLTSKRYQQIVNS